ncbi:hypothetical protein JOB18_037711 [Solea senegalensis]|uniref:Uncharacterized protein n=1 Tax=Solea senegalensis TaxID=28829 RepID=A0AAV6QVG6_SOLSE|nr:hypothetical protein JOB18_037711 [Solea senegalensis]
MAQRLPRKWDVGNSRSRCVTPEMFTFQDKSESASIIHTEANAVYALHDWVLCVQQTVGQLTAPLSHAAVALKVFRAAIVIPSLASVRV